jgi:hypothetical protein
MDRHKSFIEGGEKIYAPKPDSVSFLPGIYRMKFQSWIRNSPNVQSVDIFWNSGQDSLIIPVTPSAGLDSVEAIFTLPLEKSYTFTVRHTDTYGHRSLTVTGFAASYGEVYRSTLRNRIVTSIAVAGAEATISWFTAEDNLAGCEVRYTDVNSEVKVIKALPGELSTVCHSAKSNSTFEYRSLYLPESNAIDTFYLGWEELFPMLQFDKTDWRVLSCSDEEPSDGGGKDVLIDGNLNNHWHSKWTDPIGRLPHWAIIDMVTPRRVTKIDTYRRAGNNNTKSVQYYVSNDPDPDAATWVKIMEGTYGSGDLLTLNASENTVTGRYLKIFLPDSNWEHLTSVAEVDVFGFNN